MAGAVMTKVLPMLLASGLPQAAIKEIGDVIKKHMRKQKSNPGRYHRHPEDDWDDEEWYEEILND